MNATSVPRTLVLSISTGQAALLLPLSMAFDRNWWPAEAPLWSFPLWTLALALPIMLMLGVERHNLAKLVGLSAVAGFVLALMGVYVGWQCEPFDDVRPAQIAFIYTLTVIIAVFKALIYIQCRANGVPVTYATLFQLSWRNFLITALAVAFVTGVGLLLALWATLFSLIGIGFFRELFWQPWFYVPVLTLAFGTGVLIFRNLVAVIDSINRLLEGLLRLLLPPVVALSVLFVAALPFTGLDALWDFGRGTALLLWLTAIVLFCVNAVYQCGTVSVVYPRWLHAGIALGLLALPIVCAISFHGLWLRVEQYGWTVGRAWAMTVWAILTLFSVGYSLGVVRWRDNWPVALARVNRAMGLVILLVMVLVNSPVLDFRELSLRSQVARVMRGELTWAEFDFAYTAYHLGRPGYLLRERLLADASLDRATRQLIEEPLRMARAQALGGEVFWSRVSYRPEPFDIPVEARVLLGRHLTVAAQWRPTALRIDLDRDGEDDIVLLWAHDGLLQGTLAYRDAVTGRYRTRHLAPVAIEHAETLVREGTVSTSPGLFDDLIVGRARLRVQ